MAGFKKVKPGDKNKDVKALQEKINKCKPKTKVKTDGQFGPKTEEALKEVLKKKKIRQKKPIVDEQIYDALDA